MSTLPNLPIIKLPDLKVLPTILQLGPIVADDRLPANRKSNRLPSETATSIASADSKRFVAGMIYDDWLLLAEDASEMKNSARQSNRAVYEDERQAALAMPFAEWLELAMDAAGVPDDERADGSVWLGGLACPFGEYYLPAKGRLGYAETVADTAFDDTLAEEREDPLWHFSFCLDHQCNVNSGLIGNTNTTGEMSAYFWVEKEASGLGPPGLYNLARAAEYEGSPGLLAAEAVARDGVQGQSIGFWIVDEDPDEEADVNGKEMMLYTITAIDLVEGSGVDHAAYTTTFIRSGVYGGDMEDEKSASASAETETSAEASFHARDGFQVRCECRLHQNQNAEDTAKSQTAEVESAVARQSPKGAALGRQRQRPL